MMGASSSPPLQVGESLSHNWKPVEAEPWIVLTHHGILHPFLDSASPLDFSNQVPQLPVELFEVSGTLPGSYEDV